MKYDLFVAYIQFEKRFSSHTIQAYKNDLEQFQTYLLNAYGDIANIQITHHHVRSWIIAMVEEKLTSKTINRKISTLKSFFRFLLKKGKIDKDPMLKVIAPKMGQRLPIAIREEHLEHLQEKVQYSDDFGGYRDKLIIELLYQTGIRRSELIHLQVSDVDFNRQVIKVLGKRNKERLIPINQELSLLIQKYMELRGSTFPDLLTIGQLLLTDKGRPLYPKYVYNHVKKYLSLVTTQQQKSPHTLRHSFATHLSNNGADLNAIKALLGHASLAATQIYTHNSAERLKAIYQQAHPKATTENDS